uniref:EGF-like domain-containing protein n=1 Tax=Heterorhabditis bacteriophora TaxID=37862 RepID=A0A1I7XTS4_HETBA
MQYKIWLNKRFLGKKRPALNGLDIMEREEPFPFYEDPPIMLDYFPYPIIEKIGGYLSERDLLVISASSEGFRRRYYPRIIDGFLHIKLSRNHKDFVDHVTEWHGFSACRYHQARCPICYEELFRSGRLSSILRRFDEDRAMFNFNVLQSIANMREDGGLFYKTLEEIQLKHLEYRDYSSRQNLFQCEDCDRLDETNWRISIRPANYADTEGLTEGHVFHRRNAVGPVLKNGDWPEIVLDFLNSKDTGTIRAIKKMINFVSLTMVIDGHVVINQSNPLPIIATLSFSKVCISANRVDIMSILPHIRTQKGASITLDLSFPLNYSFFSMLTFLNIDTLTMKKGVPLSALRVISDCRIRKMHIIAEGNDHNDSTARSLAQFCQILVNDHEFQRIGYGCSKEIRHEQKTIQVSLRPRECFIENHDIDSDGLVVIEAMIPEEKLQFILSLTTTFQVQNAVYYGGRNISGERIDHMDVSANSSKNLSNLRKVYFHTYKNVNRTRRHTVAECCPGWASIPGKEGCQRDIDECSVANGGCSHRCVNSPGGHRCECSPGMQTDSAGRKCVANDPCMENKGGCQHHCVSENGRVHCQCFTGYRLSYDRKSCTDIDECAIHKGGGCEHECVNTYGSYSHRMLGYEYILGFRCRCRPGFTLSGDGRSCEEHLSGCQVANGGCQHDCYDQPDGGHVCKCRDGYDLQEDGATCKGEKICFLIYEENKY